MLPRCLGFAAAVLSIILLSGQAQSQDEKLPITLKILLPVEDAKLKIDDTETKQTGSSRTFASPPVATGKTSSTPSNGCLGAEQLHQDQPHRTRSPSGRRGDGGRFQAGQRRDQGRRHGPLRADAAGGRRGDVQLASVGKDDVVYDLGCGDGRMVITAVKKFGAKKGVGIDIDPQRIKECEGERQKAGVEDKVEFRKGTSSRSRTSPRPTWCCSTWATT